MGLLRTAATRAASMAWAAGAAVAVALAGPAAAAAAKPSTATATATATAVAACILPPGRLNEFEMAAALARLPQCQSDLDWLLALGQQLNLTRRYEDAADLIERALLLEPALKGARVDYAIALAGSGDILAARGLLADLLAQPDLPSGLRNVLLNQRSALPLAVTGGWRVDGNAGLRLGHDSNLLGAPDLGSLTLTLGGQLVEVLLDDSYRARAGSYRQADASVGVIHVRQGGLRWVASVGARNRSSPGAPAADSRQAEGLTELAAPLGANLRGYAAVASAQLSSGLTDYTTRTILLGLEGAAGSDCDLRVGAESQSRRYRNNELLSGRYSGWAASLVCGGGHWAVEQGGYGLLNVRLGSDTPDDRARPGGRQRQGTLRLALSQPLPDWGTGLRSHLLVDVEWSRQMDAQPYSPIIDSGRTRSVTRQALRLEWRLLVVSPPFGRLEPAVGVDLMLQRSNIALFGLRSHGPYVALRARW